MLVFVRTVLANPCVAVAPLCRHHQRNLAYLLRGHSGDDDV